MNRTFAPGHQTDERPPLGRHTPTGQGAWQTPAPRDASDAGGDQRMAWLLRTIEADIIPRLMLAHRAPVAFERAAPPERVLPHADDVADFSRIVLGADAAESMAYVETRRTEGMTLETIYTDLLAPAARRLGALWEVDQCDFAQVTLGLWRIQQIMYDLSPTFQRHAPEASRRKRAMLVTLPDTQHTLGLFMVAEFFRKAGWSVWSEPGVPVPQMLSAVGDEWFDVVGLSVGTELHVDALSAAVPRLRQASLNPAICVMVGGPLVAIDAKCVSRIGADATAADANAAVARAEQWVSQRVRCR